MNKEESEWTIMEKFMKDCGLTRMHENNEVYLKCEFCAKTMTEEEHGFCDICPDCREECED
mgnify:FL=1